MPPRPGEGTPPEIVQLRNSVPTTLQVLASVVKNLDFEGRPVEYFDANFTASLVSMMGEGYRLLHAEQKRILPQIISLSDQYIESDPVRADALMWFGIKSLQNQSRKRAGVHMERCVSWLLTKCDIPNANGKPRTGRSDLVCPDLETFDNHQERAIVLEFKRTIRERWKEVRDEISRSGRNVWLLTLDDSISNNSVQLMAAANITLYVRTDVQATLERNPRHLRSLDSLVADLRHVVGRASQRKLVGV
ncbi:MAG: hypothetical protein L3J95_05120 [Thermoplasmata archaeon]|nr:hypothetical protein [Thermoplasmata archaeon]MCI4359782.1 hypothetical protein [Thermoplasmata archaeon]